ncbi:MAG: hypothetical protein LKK19_01040 [Bacteroidales bacterium]|nr:hypothetical protein [Bacteroidales bacterium]MCI2121272.1 hypothetical protein [Bacteroidales bacterium]MCI2146132.1 hypothetical protein [Bacteroidales bacterium]
MRKILLVTGILLLACMMPAVAQDSTLSSGDADVRVLKPLGEDADSHFLSAWKCIESGDYGSADVMLKNTLAADSTCDMAYFYLGVISEMQKKNDLAEKYYRKAVSMDTTNFWYKYYLAMFYSNTDRQELTLDIFKELVGRYPKKSSLYFDIINIYMSENRIDKALEILDKIEDIGGKSEMVGITGANLRIRKGDREGAEEYLRNYYKDCPTPKIAVMLGDYDMADYKEQEAWNYYNQAIDMDADYLPAYYGRAHADEALRRYDEYFHDIGVFMAGKSIAPDAKVRYMNDLFSQKQFVQVFSKQVDTLMHTIYAANPEDTTVCFFMAYYLYSNNRGKEAVRVLQDNIVNHAGNYQCRFELLIMYYYLQDWKSLIDAVGGLEKEYPDKPDLYQLEGTALWQTKDYVKAIECYKKMLKSAPNDSTSQLVGNSALGDLYHETGNSKMSYRHYEKALKVNPKYNPVLNNYAYYLSLEKKDLKRAYKMSKATVDSEPDNPTYLDTFGWILFLQGKNSEAKAIFKHAMIYGGRDNADILDHYAEVLYSLKEYELAFIYWNQADAADPSLGIAKKLKERKAAIGR